MTVYRPDHQDWHDKLGFDCTCNEIYADRGMVDDRCWYHRCIEVLDDFGVGVLLGKVLLEESYAPAGDGSDPASAEAYEMWQNLREAERRGHLVQVFPMETTKEEK